MELKKKEDLLTVSVRIKSPDNDEDFQSLQIVNKQPPMLLVLDKSQTFHFDNIFSTESDQKIIYDRTVKHLVEKVRDGYNCTVFAYGSTGTGKTYTMGTNPDVLHEDDAGLIPRTIDDFFATSDVSETVHIEISFIEIYNEKAFDLLADHNVPLTIKGFNVNGYKKIKIFDAHTAMQYLKCGGSKRHIGDNSLNTQSSRSHAIFTLHYNTKNNKKQISAKLNLVDLAGSEGVKKTGNKGCSFHEGININKGLLSLGQVMTALGTSSAYIPYRQSILTTILQDSLNKKNYISLIACVSPLMTNLGETLQTLEFSQRVKKIKNKPEINQFLLQYKKENPDLFTRGLTPAKKSSWINSFETPCRQISSLSTIEELNMMNSFDAACSKTAFSCNVSAVSSAAQQISTPLTKQDIDAMEERLLNKLENLITTSLRPAAPYRTRQSQNKENCFTPSFSWEKVAGMVRSGISNFVKDARATSSPVEEPVANFTNVEKILKPRQLLVCDDSNLSMDDREFQECVNKDDDLFKVPEPLNSRNSKKAPRRSSLRLQLKKVEPYPKPPNDGHRRRSARLQMRDATSKTHKPNKSVITERSWSDVHKTKKPKNIIISNCLTDSPVTKRTNYILHLLNNGSLRELEKIHTVGPKTAEKIILYREINGSFQSVSDIANIPYWNKNKYEKFVNENFLRG